MDDIFARAHTFSLVTLGCKVNRVESDTLAAVLLQHGLVAVTSEHADVIIVNTCTVTADADKKARKALRAALRAAPDATVIATGCAAAIHPDMFTSIDKRVLVCGRTELLECAHAHTPARRQGSKNPDEKLNGASCGLRVGEGFRTRVSIKVQDGCNNACSFCIVHVARGSACSVPFNDVRREARRYFEAGVKELVLTGIDLGSYQCEGRRIADMVACLLADAREVCSSASALGDYPPRLRLSSIEPLTLDDALIELLATSEGQLCRHLHIPLQSGSSKVLHEMGRHYSAEEFVALVERLYAAVPRLSLTTDIICGFPGETQADFEDTLALAQAARFSKIHVFPYSRRAGTPAAERADQLPFELIAERAAILRARARELRACDYEARRGSEELVLMEGTTGLTESYHKLTFNAADAADAANVTGAADIAGVCGTADASSVRCAVGSLTKMVLP